MRFLLRWIRGVESASDLAERLGGGIGARNAIWLHGASNGELASARHLAGAIAETFSGCPLVITANTVSGRDLAAGWNLPVAARLAPLDLRWILRRFRARWHPAVLIVLENEIWPNRFATAREPVLMVGARMSARSAARWARGGKLARAALSNLAYLLPQDARSGERFAALGVDSGRIGPPATLKSSVAPPQPSREDLARLQPRFPRTGTILAASTHKGEERIVLDAFRKARAADSSLKLIMAPRHPRRSAEIAQLLGGSGFAFAVRSKGERPEASTAVYLADTLGEMALWYALAGRTFVGGSLVPAGGHTPFEPAAFGSAILAGPGTSNFAEAYSALDGAGGIQRCRDAETLASGLLEIESPRAQRGQAKRAQAALDAFASRQHDPVADILERIGKILQL